MGEITLQIINHTMTHEQLRERVKDAIDEGMAPYDDQTRIYEEGVVFISFSAIEVMEHEDFETSLLKNKSVEEIHDLLMECRRHDYNIYFADGSLDFDEFARICTKFESESGV